jgi:arylsulfatase A-like enzyme/Tfp pilus assembly protein PilF
MGTNPKKRTTPVGPPRRAALRSWFVLWLLGLAAAVAVVWFTRGTTPPAFVTTAEQNVLLITIDTLRGDALGVYGGRAATPNLDRLAAGGVRFSFAHAHAVVTLPSHASILTGRNPFEHGVRDNAGYRLADSHVTLAEMARAKGFATGAFVGAFPLDRQFGLAQGFDVYDDLSAQAATTSDFAFSERTAGDVVAKAREWIGRQQSPWFAWVHVFDPHAPYAAPPPFAQQYAGDTYAGEVAYTDHALGPLLELARGSARPTTVIVTADHGEGLGEHSEITHGVFAYESTLRVPLILAQVGGAAASTPQPHVSDAAVRHIDIAPTIARLAALDAPADLPGRSLLDALDASDAERTTYFEAMTGMLVRGWAPLRGVIAGREKYIDLPIEELYDLAADPGETNNRVATAGDRVRALAGQLKSLGAALPGEQVDENADVRARLQSLGYVSGSAPRKAQYTEADDPKRLIDVDRLMMQGIELHRAGRSREAMEAYRQVIARRPDMGLAYRRLAYIQWDLGAAAEAIATLQEATAKLGPDVETDIRLGTYFAETGNAKAALPLLQRATAAAPGNTEAMNALGIAYARDGRPDEALATFARILQVDPRDAHAHENSGTVHLQRGDLAAAAAAFRQVLAEGPGTSRAHAGLGVVASQQGRDADAIDSWRRAVELDARNFDALFNLATTLIRTGRAADARPYARQFVQTAPPGFYGREIAQFRAWLGE